MMDKRHSKAMGDAYEIGKRPKASHLTELDCQEAEIPPHVLSGEAPDGTLPMRGKLVTSLLSSHTSGDLFLFCNRKGIGTKQVSIRRHLNILWHSHATQQNTADVKRDKDASSVLIQNVLQDYC